MLKAIQMMVAAVLTFASILCGLFGFGTLWIAEFQPFNQVDPTYAIAWLLAALLFAFWARSIER